VHNNLGTVFTIDLNGSRNSIDPYRLTVAGTAIVRMYQPGNLVLDKNYPDTAVCGLPGVGRLATVNRDICGVCAGLCRSGQSAGGRPQPQCKRDQGQKAGTSANRHGSNPHDGLTLVRPILTRSRPHAAVYCCDTLSQ